MALAPSDSDQLQSGAFHALNRRAAAASLWANGLITIAKFAAAGLTGSVSLLSEAIHSLTDVVSSMAANVSIRMAEEPADEGHPYGHKRIETVAALAESTLMIVLALYVLVQAIEHLFEKSSVKDPAIGAIVLAASAAVSLGVGAYVSFIAKRTGSVALKSNGIHLQSDFWASFAVLVAIVGLWITGWQWLDGTVGILLSIWLIHMAWGNGYDAVQQLIDRALPEDVVRKIREEAESFPGVVSCHKIRTRQSGEMKMIDLHIVVPNDWTVVQGHNAADSLEKRIEQDLAPAQVVIHVDPFDPEKAARVKPEAGSGSPKSL